MTNASEACARVRAAPARRPIARTSLLVALLAATSSPSCSADPSSAGRGANGAEDASLVIAGDGSAEVTGVVLENRRGCVADSTCYLRLRARGEELRVIYHPGEGGACTNEDATARALEIHQGERVRARGAYAKLGALHVLSTCGSLAYYVAATAPGS